jgi:hypothetical protein
LLKNKSNTTQKSTNWASCHLIIKFFTWKLYRALELIILNI